MRRQNGMALLILLSLVLIAVTAVAVSHLSLNSQSLNRAKNTVLVLSYSKNILIGYAMGTTVLGTLPCPDINNDGEEDRIGQACINRRGLLPYKTLGIAKQVDGSGQSLWYVVDRNYVGDPATGTHNSSHPANLEIDAVNSYVFIVIAANSPLPGQSPDVNVLDAAQFLEGENANNSVDTYTALKDETHNDVLLGMTQADFWPVVEKAIAN